jgi:hypothetical protein
VAPATPATMATAVKPFKSGRFIEDDVGVAVLAFFAFGIVLFFQFYS